MLENSRFEPGETENDPALARQPAELAELYVNDAFGAAHRAHATTHGVSLAQHLPGHAGLGERELQELGKVRDDPEPPLVVVLGGAKVTDKIGVIEKFLDAADEIPFIGGAMCFSFFKAEGRDTGESLPDDGSVEAARDLLPRAERPRRDSTFPKTVLGREFSADTEVMELNGVDVLEGWMGLDIGANTAAKYSKLIAPPAPCCGTARWALSSWGRSQRARGSSPRRWPRPPLTAWSVAATRPPRWSSSASTMTWTGSTGGGASLEFLEELSFPGWMRCSTRARWRMADRTPILAANWKMNKTAAEAEEFLNALLPRVPRHGAEVVICPPYAGPAGGGRSLRRRPGADCGPEHARGSERRLHR